MAKRREEARPRYIASCSCGKDSLAMVYKLIEENYPLIDGYIPKHRNKNKNGDT